jgi:hypothetical protein
MNRWTRLAAAFVLSLVACGVAQHAAIIIGEGKPLAPFVEVFTPLAVAVAAVTVLFAIVVRCGPYAGRLTLVLLPVMAAAGTALYIAGVNSRSPGMAGNLFHGLANLVVFYFLAPCALAVAIHWLMLRRG